MRAAFFVSLVLLATTGCSVRKYAINKLGDALAGTGSTFAADDDPELIRGAIPFSLKLVESLLAESPRHEGLLLAAARGFTQYSFAFVQMDADEIEDRDRAAAQALRARSAKLYLRAREFGMRGLELHHPGFREQLKAKPADAVKALHKGDVGFMYWTALSWAAALSASRDFAMLPQIPQFEALIARALELDEGYEQGVLHQFLITYEMARLGLMPAEERISRASKHYERAVALGGGKQCGPLVSYAENVMVARKDRAEFTRLLDQALKMDLNAAPEYRQLNLAMQRRARWLLSRADRLFPKS